MPKLKQLTLQGFKSFADETLLVFPGGITAIIGPNGSGKSNVADAIRWVLGERRISTLRGKSGEDMIFAGSKRRARAGMARVALVFDNSDGWMPVDYSEVTIERRLFRSGESEYLLNGSRIRLMDLSDLLDRAGLGRDAYLIIGQGLVDHVLSLRPQERVLLFEQAAGITPYRNRRDEALQRLEETQRNLERARDILSEIEPRLHRLEKQAQRYEHYQRLNQELKNALKIWYGYRWYQSLTALDMARSRQAYQEERVQKRAAVINDLETRMAALRQEAAERRRALTALHHAQSETAAQAEALQRELAVALERRRLLQTYREEAQANLIPLQTTLEAQAEELQTLSAALATSAEALQAAQTALQEAEAAYAALQAQRQAILERQSALQSQALAQRHQLADRQSRSERAAERLAELERRLDELNRSQDEAQARVRAEQAEVTAARNALAQAEEALRAHEAEEEALRAAREAAQTALEQLRREWTALESERQQLAARFDALERLAQEGTGLYPGVRAVLHAVEKGHLRGLPGTFASLVRVPPHLERALEVALGSHLQDVIAETWQDAEAAIAWLKQQRAGRATFLPLDTLRPGSLLDVPAAPGVVGLAAALVDYDPALRPAVHLLLGRVAVAERLDAARRLFARLSGSFQIVTLEGEILRSGGALTGGEGRAEQERGSLLARERERRELPEKLEQLAARSRALRSHLQELEAEINQRNEAFRRQREQRQSLERARHLAARKVDEAVQALEAAQRQVAWQQRLRDETMAEQQTLTATLQRLEQEREAARQALQALEAQLAATAQELEALDDAAQARLLAERRTALALRAQEHDTQRLLLETRQRERDRLQHQLEAQRQRLQGLETELAALEQTLDTLRARYETARQAALAVQAQIPELEAQVTGAEQAQSALEAQVAEARAALHEVEQQSTQAQLAVRRLEEQLLTLRHEIEEALGILIGDLPLSLPVQQPLPLASFAVPLPEVHELPEGLETQLRELRMQLRRLEPINPAAWEEYQEVRERHTFLAQQIQDLETASAHLRQVVTELEGMMEATFKATFKAVAREFSVAFETLFNGGTAKLEQVEDGIEIIARPPGKRTSGLGMLSGGERTLTAMALLFAVLRVSPTPFCVLDEVDAMLDEANVGRFRAMLQDLARQTQMLIITHNRGTVEAAEAIYGVSMGEDGVSKVLSLKLEELPTSDEK